jgi:hypothetical protein
MAKRKKTTSHRQERRFTVRGVRRDPVDMSKLSRALIGLAIAEAECEAQAEQAVRTTATPHQQSGKPTEGGVRNA